MQPKTDLDLWMSWQSGLAIPTCANESLLSWVAMSCHHRQFPQPENREVSETSTIIQTGGLLRYTPERYVAVAKPPSSPARSTLVLSKGAQRCYLRPYISRILP